MNSFQTQFDFVLPKGFVDDQGTLHKNGVMRLATAADEILPLKDPRVQQNVAYLSVVLLSRVVVKLGTLAMISTKTIEDLFASDFAFLQDMYNRINQHGADVAKVNCPKCEHSFNVEMQPSGE